MINYEKVFKAVAEFLCPVLKVVLYFCVGYVALIAIIAISCFVLLFPPVGLLVIIILLIAILIITLRKGGKERGIRKYGGVS